MKNEIKSIDKDYLESLNELDLIRLSMANNVHKAMTRCERLGIYRKLEAKCQVIRLVDTTATDVIETGNSIHLPPMLNPNNHTGAEAAHPQNTYLGGTLFTSNNFLIHK